MVGDLQRIMEYPSKGWMAPQVVPEDVKSAFRYLLKRGYSKLLVDQS